MARILVIDDNPAIRQVMQCCLPGMGHAVTTAPDGETGLKLATVDAVDLVLLDVDMPRLNGLSVCKALKDDPARRHIPVVMMTGRPTSELRRRVLDAGATTLLEKPFTWEALSEELNRCLPVVL
ncbi:MAG: sensory box histidine kinase PhoR [Verrucomicrobia bacterium]|nr:sensory box histidine kinase PhoR [Verrucomicrobiota bacterium]